MCQSIQEGFAMYTSIYVVAFSSCEASYLCDGKVYIITSQVFTQLFYNRFEKKLHHHSSFWATAYFLALVVFTVF